MMENKNTNNIYLKILAVLSIMFVLCFYCFCFPLDNVSADTSDNAVLNFNQQYKEINSTNNKLFNTNAGTITYGNNNVTIVRNTSYTGTIYDYSLGLNSNNGEYTFIKNHKYYFTITMLTNFNSQLVGELWVGTQCLPTNTLIANQEYKMDTFLVPTTNVTKNILFYCRNQSGSGTLSATYSNIMLIDLTQMFGSGNEPTTIEQVKKYIVSDYYSYTSSTLISNSYFTAYENAINDIFNASQYNIVASDSYNNLVTVNIGSESSVIQKATQQLDPNYYILTKGHCGLPMSSTLSSGTKVIVSGYFSAYGSNSTAYVNIGYVKNNTYIRLDKVEVPTTQFGDFVYAEKTIILTEDISTLVFGISGSSNNTDMFMLGDIQINVSFTDINTIIESAVQRGMNSVDTNYYFEQGRLQGISESQNAWGSSWDFITTAFVGIGNIMSLEIFPNVPLWTFVAIPLLFGLITFIYKLTGNN